MYTVRHVLSCHFSLSPRLTLTPSLSIYPSRLICHTICAAVISRAPRVLPFTPLLLSPPVSPLHAWPPSAWLFDWLVCIPPQPRSQVPCVQKCLTHATACLPLLSKPGRLTQHCLRRRVKACHKRECDNLYTCSLRGMYKMRDHSTLTKHHQPLTVKSAQPEI